MNEKYIISWIHLRWYINIFIDYGLFLIHWMNNLWITKKSLILIYDLHGIIECVTDLLHFDELEEIAVESEGKCLPNSK